jgi:O-methyltransferase involved in polyketide biosynthesis
MTPRRPISESAFLVNESRSRGVALSRDVFAHLWVTAETRRLWEDFSREVYPLDDVELALRNRFYLDVLETSLRKKPEAVFVNLAAGFTSYPFLADAACRAIEVDFEHICRYKRSKITEWRDEGLVPNREIEFIACDLSDERDVEALGKRLQVAIGPAPSVVFLEGITYYLKRESLARLLAVLEGLQPAGSIVALDFWSPDFENHPVQKRFRKFFAERFAHPSTEYNFFDADFLRSLGGHEIVELTDIVGLEGRFSAERRLADPEAILPERYAVLERRERI